MAATADARRLIPDCRVSVGGKKLALDQDARLTKVEVDLDVDLFGQCVLSFHDPKLALIDGNDFRAGVHVKVEIGFASNMTGVFEGEVVALEPQFRRDLPPSLRVVCQESLHRLALQTRTRAFMQADDHEIVKKIAQEHGLSAQAPSGTKEHVLQSNVSDAVLLRRLAQKSGNHVRIEHKKLILGPPPKGAQITLRPGDGIEKMRVRIDANSQVGEVAVHGWDPTTKQEVVAKTKAQGETGKGSRDHGAGFSQAMAGNHPIPPDVASAEAMAKGRMRKLAEGFVTAQVDMIGDARLHPGAELTLEKFGEQLDGVYRVEKARHAFSRRGYFTSVRAVRLKKGIGTAQQRQAAAQARAQAAQQAAVAAAGQTSPSKRTFIELELVDERGYPVPGERWEIVTEDGRTLGGILDDGGKARVEDVEPGTCTVTYPDLHADAWRKR